MSDNDTPKYGLQNHGFMASNDALPDKCTNSLSNINLQDVVAEKNEAPQKKLQLQREIGLFSATNLIIGVIIGSGIFVSPSLALERTGSVGLCLVIWAVCGVISLLGALCFAELGILMPRSGAEYVYLQEAFGNLHKFWGPLPSFLCSWVYVMVCRPAEVAVIILAFSEYVCQPFEMYFGTMSMEYRDLARKLISLIGLALLTFINYISVKVFVRVQNLFTMTKLFACCVVAAAGIYELCRGNTSNISQGFGGSNLSLKNISLAFYYCLWPYDGWSTVTIVTEEVKKPEVYQLHYCPRIVSVEVKQEVENGNRWKLQKP